MIKKTFLPLLFLLGFGLINSNLYSQKEETNFEFIKSGETRIEAAKFYEDKEEPDYESGIKILQKINEYYNTLFLPKSDYEDFKNVINAAADFNKVVLVFEKG